MNARANGLARSSFGVVALAALAACADWPASVPVSPPAPQPRAAIAPGPYTPGQMYTGRNGYIEYYAGNSPVIFAAPHGGNKTPAEIADRNTTSCNATNIVLLADLYTREIAMEIRTAFYNRTGRYPHVIVNTVHRKKVEPNRDLAAGACQDLKAEIAWQEYHDFIDVARARVADDHGRGWFTDIHGHAHDIKRLELGYLLEAADLRQTDATLDGSVAYEQESSFRTLSAGTTVSFSRLLRGPASLGTLLAEAGHPSVPSASDPAPDVGEPYFNGGYSTDRHGCILGTSAICGVQIEHDTNVKIPDSARATYVANLMRAYETYLAQNFGFSMATGMRDIMVDNDNLNNDTTRARFAGAGSWTSSTQGTQKHLNSYLLNDGANSTDDAWFRFYIDSAGTYKVYARWPSATSHTTAATYRVELDGGTVLADTTVNQQAGGGEWNLLGTYGFNQVGWARVVVPRYGASPGTVAVDAVRIVRQ